MRRLLIVLILVLSLMAVAVTKSHGQSHVGTLAVVMEELRGDIPDFTLRQRLNDFLVMRAGQSLLVPSEDSALPPPPDTRFDPERLMWWGQEVGCRYIIYVQVDDRRLETRKKFSVPWVLNRYEVEGRLTGNFALLDLTREKVLGVWPLEAVLSGPCQWQVMDDYPGDPDLNLTAPQEILFLKKLEDVAVKEMYSRLEPYLRKGR